MGGKILNYEAKDILNKGISIGEERGEIKGKIKFCIDLIHDGLLSVAEAAKRLNMEESELQKYL